MSRAAAGLARLGVVTTGALADSGCKLELQCRRCARTVIAEPYELRGTFPNTTPLREAGRRFRCERCGQRDPQMWVWIMGWTRDKRRRRG